MGSMSFQVLVIKNWLPISRKKEKNEKQDQYPLGWTRMTLIQTLNPQQIIATSFTEIATATTLVTSKRIAMRILTLMKSVKDKSKAFRLSARQKEMYTRYSVHRKIISMILIISFLKFTKERQCSRTFTKQSKNDLKSFGLSRNLWYSNSNQMNYFGTHKKRRINLHYIRSKR
jgi:hypothetical protein